LDKQNCSRISQFSDGWSFANCSHIGTQEDCIEALFNHVQPFHRVLGTFPKIKSRSPMRFMVSEAIREQVFITPKKKFHIPQRL